MSSSRQIELLVGTAAGFFTATLNPTVDETTEFLSLIHKNGITHIDTAAFYPSTKSGRSETLLGQANAKDSFVLDTKIMVHGGHGPDAGGGDLSRDKITESVNASLERLGVDKVNVIYCHRPDPVTPIEETAKTFDELHKQGKFFKWGLSNYSPDAVRDILAVCEKNGYVKPTVYQGMYNPFCRHSDKKLFPLLEDNGIAFMAYSPSAGGLFAQATSSRYDGTHTGGVTWTEMYQGHSKLKEGLESIINVSEKNDITQMEACLRWVVHHSPLRKGDGVILGVRNKQQLEENVASIRRGPLPVELIKCFEDVWESVQDVAPGEIK